MITKNLIKAVKAFKGPIYVQVNSRDNSLWIQAVKSDLIWNLENNCDLESWSGFEIDASGFFSSAEPEILDWNA